MQREAGQNVNREAPLSDLVDSLCDAFEQASRAGETPRIEDYLERCGEHDRGDLLEELVGVACYWHRRRGEEPNLDDFLARFPERADRVRQGFVSEVQARRESRVLSDTVAVASEGQRTLPRESRLGEYELLHQLGQGGMGVVYLARQLNVDRLVALKLIRREFLTSEFGERRAEVLDRFQHEARAAGRLQHDHIVAVYDVGEAEGQPYYAMQFIEGKSLADVLKEGPLPDRRAARYIEAVARAVHFAHLRGILHRDLKPANVLIEESTDRAKVTDFGLAKFTENKNDLTLSGQVLGTPAYMSPEQAKGADQVTALSDVYSLGATLYQMLGGRPPFDADSPVELLRQVVDCDPEPLKSLVTGVSRDLDTICSKCLEKEPARRYASAEALADDLVGFLTDRPISARPLSTRERVWKWMRRQPAAAGLISLGVLAPLALLVVSWIFNLQLSEALGRAENSEAGLRQRQAALTQRQRELSQALYDNGIALANQHLLAHRLDAAARALDDCPRELRDWRWKLLDALARGYVAELAGETGLAADLEFSPDGRLVATAGNDGFVRVWNVQNGEPGKRFSGHQREVFAVSFAPDSRRIASAADTTVRVWNAESGQQERVLDHGTGLVSGVAFSPSGDLIATASIARTEDGVSTNLHLWKVADGTQLRSWEVGKGVPAILAFSPNGQQLTSGSAIDGTLKIWSCEDQALLATNSDFGGRLSHIEYSPNGKWIGASGESGAALYDAETGKLEQWLTPPEEREMVNSISFRADSELVALATFSGDVRILGSADHKLRHTLAGVGMRADFHPLTHQLAVTSPEGQVRIWNADGRRQELRCEAGGNISALALVDEGRNLALGTTTGRLLLFDAADGHVLHEIQADPDFIRDLQSGRLGKRIVTLGGPGIAKVWNATNGELVQSPAESASLIALDPAEHTLALGDYVGNVVIWDIESAKVRARWPAHRVVNALAISPDGENVATAGMDRQVRLWSNTGDNLWTLPFGEETQPTNNGPLIIRLVFSTDGDLLAGAGRDRRVRLWKASSGKLLRTIRCADPVFRMGFTPDGHWLTTLGVRSVTVDAKQVVLQEGVTRVWRVEDGKEALTLTTRDDFGALWFETTMGTLATNVGSTATLWRLAPSIFQNE